MWVRMEHSAALTTEKQTNKKAAFFSGVSTSMPIMFLKDLCSSCMYPGKQQVRYLKGKRFKIYGYRYFPLILEFFPQIALTSAGAIQTGQSKLPLSPYASAMFKIAVFLSHNKIKSRIISVSRF